MSGWKISPPAAGGGFNKEEHVDHLCVFVDPKAEETPKFSGEGVQIAARCAYAICETCGLVLTDPLIYGDALAPRIADAGEVVAGRLALGKARAGRNAPYFLNDPSGDDLQAVEAFLEKYAVRLPSGKIVVETPAAENGEEAF
jgi:hypothetical protein